MHTCVRAWRTGAPRIRGFTLIELLVVLVILGVIVATATLAVGVLGGDRELEDQAQRFAAILQQAREEAEVQGMDVGVLVTTGALDFFRHDSRKGRWTPFDNDPLFVTREMPEGVRLRLWVESREVILKKEVEPYDEAKPDRHLPQITLLASGEINPFELRFEREGSNVRWRVTAGADSSIRAELMNAQER